MTNPQSLQYIDLLWIFSIATASLATPWTLSTRLDDGQAAYSVATRSVTHTANHFCVGVPGADTSGFADAGAAYIYSRAGVGWSRQQTISAPDPQINNLFGITCEVGVALIAVCARNGDTNTVTDAGAVYVYRLDQANVWQYLQKLTATDATNGYFFGHAMAFSGNDLLIGDPLADPNGQPNAGRGYFYTYSGSNLVWTATFLPSDTAQYEYFGTSVSATQTLLLLGADQDDLVGAENAGSAYIYTKSGGLLTGEQKLVANDYSGWSLFGLQVSLTDSFAVIGARDATVNGCSGCGATYVFSRAGSSFAFMTKLTASDYTSVDEYGLQVAIWGNYIAIGSYLHDWGGMSNAGAVYLYTLTGSQWGLHQKMTASDVASNDYYGAAISLSYDYLAVLAMNKDHSGWTDVGAVYLYLNPWITSKLQPLYADVIELNPENAA